MNEELTKEFPGKKSFEERVFARFDSVDLRLGKLEERSYDTKPIWEQALTAIMETGKEVTALRSDMGEVKNRIRVIESAVAGLATDVGDLKAGYGGIKNELVDIRREVRENIRQELSQILKRLIEDRQDIRDAEDRIRKLETKLA
jgi:chromosome segregation ATPase